LARDTLNERCGLRATALRHRILLFIIKLLHTMRQLRWAFVSAVGSKAGGCSLCGRPCEGDRHKDRIGSLRDDCTGGRCFWLRAVIGALKVWHSTLQVGRRQVGMGTSRPGPHANDAHSKALCPTCRSLREWPPGRASHRCHRYRISRTSVPWAFLSFVIQRSETS
jgi:hypothetical protein